MQKNFFLSVGRIKWAWHILCYYFYFLTEGPHFFPFFFLGPLAAETFYTLVLDKSYSMNYIFEVSFQKDARS